MTNHNKAEGPYIPGAMDDIEELRHFAPLGLRVKVLMVWPLVPTSFWSFEGMMKVIPEQAVIPPLGLITVAALCPKDWEIRLVDRAFDELHDDDLRWADIVMVSAMHAQREDARVTLQRAHILGRRTMIGGPYASSEPDALLLLADHVVVGEPDGVFGKIAADLESGWARRLYVIREKPDLSCSPVPRFDLLALDNYASMAVQFSRGCPFQCEFCDIITIYGRQPRTKSVGQFISELEALRRLGWRKQVFIVDDNFIGNHKRALELAQELAKWQSCHKVPFMLYTEASADLATRPQLQDAMVRANFFYVFIGIETPVSESLKEAKKYQNLRNDPLESVKLIQSRGLWVTGGFIVGFDSDKADIFDRQVEFIERAAIPWAMTGFLQAPPTTPLYERMKREGRLLPDNSATTNFCVPNFKTILPFSQLVDGQRRILCDIYDPQRFYDRALRSLAKWCTSPQQKHPQLPLIYCVRVVFRSMWHQGLLSRYRRAYWRFLVRLLFRWSFVPPKLWIGFVLALSGHHFIQYAQQVVSQLERKRLDIDVHERNSDPVGQTMNPSL